MLTTSKYFFSSFFATRSHCSSYIRNKVCPARDNVWQLRVAKGHLWICACPDTATQHNDGRTSIPNSIRWTPIWYWEWHRWLRKTICGQCRRAWTVRWECCTEEIQIFTTWHESQVRFLFWKKNFPTKFNNFFDFQRRYPTSQFEYWQLNTIGGDDLPEATSYKVESTRARDWSCQRKSEATRQPRLLHWNFIFCDQSSHVVR